MLYYPLEDEVADEQIEELYNEMIDGVRKVNIVKRQVMEHLESVEEARYYVDQMKKEVREGIEENVAAEMDAMGKQDNDESDNDEDDEEIDDYQYCDPANIDKEDPQTVAMEEDPLDSVISETTLTVYGNSSAKGNTACNALQASFP